LFHGVVTRGVKLEGQGDHWSSHRIGDDGANLVTIHLISVNRDPKRQHLSEKKMVENGST
jgi:hypothetical protein